MAKKKKSSPPPNRRSTPKDKIVLPRRDADARRNSPVTAGLSGGKRPGGAPEEEGKTTADYYRLNTRAVEELVSANEENSPPVPRAELRKYHAGPKIRVADWIKAVFLKFWMGGVVCYFFVWGLSGIPLNQWDHIFILGLTLGMLTNLITNNILRFISKTPGAFDRWMMVPGKKIWFLPLDLLYGILLVFCTVLTYSGINRLAAGPSAETPALAVEPLTFGLFITLWDLLFLGCKRLLERIFRDARQKVAGGK